MSATTLVTPRAAATCVLMRPREDGGSGVEVFMVRRHIQSDFAPDVYVFPGGSVTADDRLAEQTPGLCAPAGEGPTALGSGFRAAALRECFEEAGVLLARRGGELLALDEGDVSRFAGYRDALQHHHLTITALAEQEGLTLATDALIHWAHWITPEAMPKRFDTHFFLAEMPAAQEAAHDHLETTDGIWIAPEKASAGHARGEFPLVFAQIHQLRELHGLRSFEDARARFDGRQLPTIMPRVVERDGKPVILLPDEE